MQHLGESLWYGNPASKSIPAVCESSIHVNPLEMESRHRHESPPLPPSLYGNLRSGARPRLNQFWMNLASNNKMRTDSKEWRPHSFVNHNKNLVSPRCDLKSVSGLCYMRWIKDPCPVREDEDSNWLRCSSVCLLPSSATASHLSWHNLPSKGVIQCPFYV